MWHLFIIRSQDRNKLQNRLVDYGIGNMIHYPIPCHLQESYVDLGYKVDSFPITENICKSILSLPIGPHLDKGQMQLVINSL